MAINSLGQNLATNGVVNTAETIDDKTSLGKDDFLKLLLVELQHQDPTEPMDSEKILSQTSQLATLESAQNTNDALESLAASLGNSQQFSTISAIGKRADLGSDAISHDEGVSTTFEVYFPEDIKNGVVDVKDLEGNVVASLNIDIDEELGERKSGVYQFTWDGLDSQGNPADSGIYRVTSDYTDTSDNAQTTRLGSYPIESVRFEGGQALLKLGSNYVPLESIAEVY